MNACEFLRRAARRGSTIVGKGMPVEHPPSTPDLRRWADAIHASPKFTFTGACAAISAALAKWRSR